MPGRRTVNFERKPQFSSRVLPAVAGRLGLPCHLLFEPLQSKPLQLRFSPWRWLRFRRLPRMGRRQFKLGWIEPDELTLPANVQEVGFLAQRYRCLAHRPAADRARTALLTAGDGGAPCRSQVVLAHERPQHGHGNGSTVAVRAYPLDALRSLPAAERSPAVGAREHRLPRSCPAAVRPTTVNHRSHPGPPPGSVRRRGTRKAPARWPSGQGPDKGSGSSPRSLSPVLTLGAVSGCQLPDAIPRGIRSCRPHSRAVHRLATDGLLSEASWPARTSGCATGPRTRRRHVCDVVSTSPSLAPGRPSLLAVRWPGATGLTSYLSGCLFLTGQRCGFPHRRHPGSCTGSCLEPGSSP